MLFPSWCVIVLNEHLFIEKELLISPLVISNGVPDWNRTNDLSLRRRSLYPTELRGHDISN